MIQKGWEVEKVVRAGYARGDATALGSASRGAGRVLHSGVPEQLPQLFGVHWPREGLVEGEQRLVLMRRLEGARHRVVVRAGPRHSNWKHGFNLCIAPAYFKGNHAAQLHIKIRQ